MSTPIIILLLIICSLAAFICHSLLDLAKFILIIIYSVLAILTIIFLIKHKLILIKLQEIEDNAHTTSIVIKQDLEFLNYKIANLNDKIDETIKKDVIHNFLDIITNAFEVMSPVLNIIVKTQGNPLIGFGYNLLKQYNKFKKS